MAIVVAIFILILVLEISEDQQGLYKKFHRLDALEMDGKLIITKRKIYRVKLVEIELKEKEST